MPVRIQRQRVRGWRKPPNTICVTRGTCWGNPFIVDPDAEPGSKRGPFYFCVPTREDALACHREMVQDTDMRQKIVRNLRGKNVACYCNAD